jgi:lysyl-tRNA synthetase class 2
MVPLLPGVRYLGRVLELVAAQDAAQLNVLVEDRLAALAAQPGCARGIAPGDLVAFALQPAALQPAATAEGPSRVAWIERIGGPQAGRPWRTGDALRWRKPGRAPSRMALLRLRHGVLRELRGFFDGQGFVEVETPAWVRAPSPEPQFAPVSAGEGYLITSPEFQLKRLLVGGLERVYRIGPAFRGGERGGQHNPEFTLLEWYRVDAGTDELAADLHALLCRLAPLAEAFAAQSGASGPGGSGTGISSHTAPPRLRPDWVIAPLRRETVAGLFRRHLGMDLTGVTTAEALLRAARAAGRPEAGELPPTFDQAFSRLWVELEPHFPLEPFLVADWPAPLARLARRNPRDPRLAERLELYAGRMELANGFAELTDPVQQRERFLAQLDQRRKQGLPPLPLDEAFLEALADGMPPAAGMALGVDRLVMLVAGAADIRDVLSFAAEEV